MQYLSENLFNGQIAQTLSWTLLHSLWQGALIAILAAIVIQSTKKRSPGFRYNLLSLLFFSFIIITTATFFWMWKVSLRPEVFNKGDVAASVTGYSAIHNQVSGMMTDSVRGRFIRFFNTYANLIVAIWFVFFSMKSIRLCAGLGQIYQLRHHQVYMPEKYWAGRLQELADRLKIKRSIKLLASNLVNVPMVIGFLKPVILIPLGLLAKLPAEQIEIILLHELAHVRRKDYFINLMQHVIEVLFFFNPFLLWISSLLREERESCCDDLALSCTQNKTTLVNALIFFQENTLHTGSRLSLGFGKAKGQLLNRVKRMASERNKSLSKAEKGFIAICLMVIAGFVISFSSSNPGNDAVSVIQEASKQTIVQNTTIEAINLTEKQDTLKVAAAITDDLIKNGIIQSADGISFVLNNKVLIVNGAKQPEMLHQQLKKQYVRGQGWSLSYNNHCTVRKPVTVMN